MYARSVTSAILTARVDRTERGWAFRAFGDCRTARIDGEVPPIDWAASRGLLGANRIGDSTYVHLAQPDAELVFGDAARRHPFVREANCLLDDGRIDEHGVTVVATAHSHRVIVIAGLAPDAEVSVSLDGKATSRTADARGELTITLPKPGTTRVEVR